ncbi:MAG TPA: PD40 domain-containing protein, partial [Candidatus Limisoma intestinavium]|nr:PD40 domain-containing protein [Candidatus Limisoma intestinavium]
MNRKISIMAASLLIVAAMPQAEANEPEVIGRPDIQVVDGKLTPEMMEAFGRVSGPQVSPDRKSVLYSVEFVNLKADKGNRELWVMDIDGKNQRQITVTPESENGAVWIKNGTKIAYMASTDDGMQIFTINPDGSEKTQISHIEKGIGGFLFSPDESKILLIRNIKYGKRVVDEYPALDKANARIVDDLMYKHWDEWVTEIPHPFLADVTENGIENPIDIMEGEPYESPMKPFGGIESFAWAPDSKSIVYVSRKKEGMEYSLSTNSDLYLYNLETKTTTNLTEGMMGYDTNPVFSPKGDKLAWLSMEHDGYESDMNRIFVMDMKTGEKTDLTENWDYTVSTIAWNPNGKKIYFIAPYHGPSPIFSVEVGSKKIETIAAQMCDYASLAPVDDKKIIALRHSLTYPDEIFLVDKDSDTQLTNVNT